MLKYLLAFLAAFALHGTASAVTWDDVVKNRDSLCAKLPPAPVIQPAAAYYKSLSPARMFCESIKYQIVKKGDKPAASAPPDLVNQPTNGYWTCGLDIPPAMKNIEESFERCRVWNRAVAADFDTIALQQQGLKEFSRPITLTPPTPEQIKNAQAEAAKKKAAADAAAAVRAIEMAETLEQAKKRIQAIPVAQINKMDISRPHGENVFRGLPPSYFCTLSPNERQAFSDEQIKGLSTQAALNLLWCLQRQNNEAVPGAVFERVLKECPKHAEGYCEGTCPMGSGGKSCITNSGG